MCEYFPHINSLWIYTLNTFWYHAQGQLLPGYNGVYTACGVVPFMWLVWLRRACRRQLEQATLPEWWRWVHHLVAPQTGASHTLSERGAWALPGPKLVRTKGARSPEAKPPCGSFPHHLSLRGDCCLGVEECGEVDVMTGTRGSGRWRRRWWLEHLERRIEAETYGRGCPVDVSQYVETMVPVICFSSRRAMFDATSVGSSSSVSCNEGLCDVWSRRNPRLRLRGSSVGGNGSTISRAEVVMNARPALWDELTREHAEARTRVVEEPAVAWLVGDEGEASGCSADVRRHWRPLYYLFYMLKVQGWEQRCVDFHIVGGTRSEVVGSVLAGGRLARGATPCCPVSLWCNGCSVGRAIWRSVVVVLSRRCHQYVGGGIDVRIHPPH
jgi:hypothetical protein